MERPLRLVQIVLDTAGKMLAVSYGNADNDELAACAVPPLVSVGQGQLRRDYYEKDVREEVTVFLCW